MNLMRTILKWLIFNPCMLQLAALLSRSSAVRRRIVSHMYLRGNGIEIGALLNPLSVPINTHVIYVDRETNTQLKQRFPEIAGKRLVTIQLIDNAETLDSIQNESQDFIITSHVIEHLENPLLAISNWFRVLKENGILYMVVPNKEETFDVNRPVTSVEHLYRDYKEGPQTSIRQHYEEWVYLEGNKSKEDVEREVDSLIEQNHNIHFHVWNPSAFFQLLNFCIDKLHMPISVKHFEATGNEILVVIQKKQILI